MKYKLVCIFEQYKSNLEKIRIEVSVDNNSKSISPFVRKLSLNDLMYGEITVGRELLLLLNHIGFSNQPFYISKKNLEINKVQSLFLNYPYNYLQTQKFGSLRLFKPSFISNNEQIIKEGKLICGVLYIRQLNSWNKDIEVRFKYENAVNDLYPIFSEIPFETIDGNWMSRNRLSEQLLLNQLGNHYDNKCSSISITSNEISWLHELTLKGWNIYMGKNNSRTNKLYFHRSSSGVVWFSDKEKELQENEILSNILQSYLKRREYCEFNGQVCLFQDNEINKIKPEKFAEFICGNGNVLSLFTPLASLVKTEIIKIDKCILKYVNAQLRSYQREGVLWLQTMRKNNRGCLLADEMGLGKTLQVLTHLSLIKSNYNHLIVAPVSLIQNWKNEINKFVPQICDKIIIISYDMLRIHVNEFERQIFDTLVIDEAQIIKNRQTQKYQALDKLKSKHRIILTGTPIENSIEEIWSHIMFLETPIKALYKSIQKSNIQTNHELFVELTSKLLKPFILRRTKKDVLTELPSKTIKNVYIDLSEKEQKNYDVIKNIILTAIKKGVTGRINSLVLEGLLRLRQLCVSSNLIPMQLRKYNIRISSKFQNVIEYISLFRNDGHKVLLFSQFVGALKELEVLLSENNLKYVTLYGDTKNRGKNVEQFEKNKDIIVFLISLKAGGVGLNLTSANRVILLDDWWNPAVEDQAMGRAHRIGQKKNVLVFRFICKNTVEEKILQLQDYKKQTVDLFNQSTGKLTIDELKGLIS